MEMCDEIACHVHWISMWQHLADNTRKDLFSSIPNWATELFLLETGTGIMSQTLQLSIYMRWTIAFHPTSTTTTSLARSAPSVCSARRRLCLAPSLCLNRLAYFTASTTCMSMCLSQLVSNTSKAVWNSWLIKLYCSHHLLTWLLSCE